MGSHAPEQNGDRQEAAPSTYLITFVCYGAWLPGQARAVDHRHNQFGSCLPESNAAGQARAKKRMLELPYLMDAARRSMVLNSIYQVCSHRGWILLAAHVRTNHVQVVVTAGHTAEQVMNDFKSYASRTLNGTALDAPNRQRWARNGSTRHLWTTESVSAAIHYVVQEQGDPMAFFQREAG